MKYFVTGGAGFIGSHIVEKLIEQNLEVIVYDNFSTGKIKYLENLINNKNLNVIEGDLLDKDLLFKSMENIHTVFHIAANADVRNSFVDPNKDFCQNLLATFNVLESMRINNCKKIIFSSTAAALGEPEIFPTPENCPIPKQTSIYGASKIGAEAIISAYCEGYKLEGYSFRFVSLLGPRYPHGHVYDFVKQLLSNPNELSVLGDGSQKKSFLNIEDCIEAIFLVSNVNLSSNDQGCSYQVFNLGNLEYVTIKDSISFICSEMKVNPNIKYGFGSRGWTGDSPFVFLDTSKIQSRGWKPKHNIESSVKQTVKWLLNNQWIF